MTKLPLGWLEGQGPPASTTNDLGLGAAWSMKSVPNLLGQAHQHCEEGLGWSLV